VASLSQGRTAAAQCGLFTHKSVPVIFEPPCNFTTFYCTTDCSHFLVADSDRAWQFPILYNMRQLDK